jgi:hypothetical protein
MNRIFRRCWAASLGLPLLVLTSLQPAALAQSSQVSIAPLPKLVIKRGGTAEVRVPVRLLEGYHVNSNTPSEDYLIPTRLTWQQGALEAAAVVYPKPEMRKYSFADRPISVFTGDFEILTRFRVSEGAASGPGFLAGKLRYQACTDDTCYPPKTVDLKLPYSVQ